MCLIYYLIYITLSYAISENPSVSVRYSIRIYSLEYVPFRNRCLIILRFDSIAFTIFPILYVLTDHDISF